MPLSIHVFETPDQAARALADRLSAELRARPEMVLGLPTGRTPVRLYAELRRRFAQGTLDVARLQTFNLDEFAGVDASDAGSFRHFMQTHLFDGVNVDPARIHFLDGMAADLDGECDRYDWQIEQAGGIDLQILGIGANGHIGFNEPGETLVARTHRVTLHPGTRRDNAALFGGDPARVPAEALTIGMGAILKSASIALMANGERKAQCVERTIRGPLTTRLPASFLQTHRHVDLYLDRGAASALDLRP
jgi:glucosamine-6-phosphate deaminase